MRPFLIQALVDSREQRPYFRANQPKKQLLEPGTSKDLTLPRPHRQERPLKSAALHKALLGSLALKDFLSPEKITSS